MCTENKAVAHFFFFFFLGGGGFCPTLYHTLINQSNFHNGTEAFQTSFCAVTDSTKSQKIFSEVFILSRCILIPTFLKGLMKLVRHTMPPSANSLATSEIRRMFSSLSWGVKLRFLLRPVRMLSPSSEYEGMPWLTRYSSRANEMVVLPAPDRPICQTARQ